MYRQKQINSPARNDRPRASQRTAQAIAAKPNTEVWPESQHSRKGWKEKASKNTIGHSPAGMACRVPQSAANPTR